MQLQLLALGNQRHRLTSRLSREADAGKTVDAVAWTAHQAVGIPAARVVATGIKTPVTGKGMARQNESRTANAELCLEGLAHLSSPIVRRGVRIAIVQDVERAILGWPRNLLEERNQGARAFERTHGMRGARADRLERHVAHLRRNIDNWRARAFLMSGL